MLSPTRPSRRRGAPGSTLLSRGLSHLLRYFVATLGLYGTWRVGVQQGLSRGVPELSKMLGEDVRVGDLRVHPTRGLVLIDVDIIRKNGRRIGHIDRAEFPIRYSGGFTLGTVRIKGLDLDLGLQDGKLDAFQNMSLSGGGGQVSLDRFPIQGLELTGTHVLFRAGDRAVEVNALELQDGRLDGKGEVRNGTAADRFSLGADLSIAPTLIGVKGFRLKTSWLSVGASADIPLDGHVKGSAELHADLPGASMHLPKGTLEGSLDLQADFTVSDPVSVRGKVAFEDIGWARPVHDGRIVALRFGTADLPVELTGTDLMIREGDWHWSSGTINVFAELDLDAMHLDQAQLQIRELSLRDILANTGASPTPWVDFIGEGEIQASGPLNPLELTGPFDLHLDDFEVAAGPVDDPKNDRVLSLPDDDLKGTLTLYPKHIELAVERLRAGRSLARGDVDIGFARTGPLDVDLYIYRANLADFQPLGGAELLGTGTVRGKLSGPFNGLGFRGTLDLKDAGFLGMRWADKMTGRVASPDMKRIELSELRGELGKSEWQGDVDLIFPGGLTTKADVEIPKGRLEDVLGIFLPLDGLTGDMEAEVHLDGPLDKMNGGGWIDLKDVSIYGQPFATGVAGGTLRDSRFTLDAFELRDAAGDAGVSAQGSVGANWALDLDLMADGYTPSHIEAVKNLPLHGELRAAAHIDGTLFRPEPKGRLVWTDARYNGNFLADSVLVISPRGDDYQFDGKLLGDALDASGRYGIFSDGALELHALWKDLPVHAALPAPANGSELTALSTGSLDLKYGDEMELSAHVDAFTADWSGHALALQEPFEVSMTGRRFEIEPFRVVGERLGSTTTDFTLSASRYRRFLPAGGGFVDLDLARIVVPGLRRSDGQVRFRFDTSTGPSVLELTLRGDALAHSAIPEGVDTLRGKVIVKREGIDFQNVRAALGGGKATVSGQVISERWMPKRLDVDIDAKDARVRWSESFPPALADAHIEIDGPLDKLLASGDIDVRQVNWVSRVDWENAIFDLGRSVDLGTLERNTEPGFMGLNIGIHAPPGTLRMSNNVADATAEADLRITGDTNNIGITGYLAVDEGRAFLQDRVFEIQRGRLDFDDPTVLDPNIDFDLLTSVTTDGQTYRIHYVIEGPYSGWATRTWSEPTLSQADINMLLWFGVRTDTLEESGMTQAVVQSVADLLITDLITSGSSRSLRAGLRYFDRLDVVTGLNYRGVYSPDPRLHVAKRFQELANLEVSAEINLVNPRDQYYRIEKSLGAAWSLALWYSTLDGEWAIPIGGTIGVDVSAQWESE